MSSLSLHVLIARLSGRSVLPGDNADAAQFSFPVSPSLPPHPTLGWPLWSGVGVRCVDNAKGEWLAKRV